MDYAIIRLGNKQHRVRDGETLVVDRLRADEGKSFEPDVLLGGKVTATVVAHERGPKIIIGKYRKRTGYKRHNGFRAATSRVQITLGAPKKAAAEKAAPKAEAPKKEVAAAPKAEKAEIKSVLPRGYAEMTVAEVKEHAATWKRPQLLGALEYEQANAARKGAISALEAALED